LPSTAIAGCPASSTFGRSRDSRKRRLTSNEFSERPKVEVLFGEGRCATPLAARIPTLRKSRTVDATDLDRHDLSLRRAGLVATFVTWLHNLSQATPLRTPFESSAPATGSDVWVSAIQRFKRRCSGLDGNTKLKSKAGHYGNDSSIVSNTVQFADRKFRAEKFNEWLRPGFNSWLLRDDPRSTNQREAFRCLASDRFNS
jgi:hypothetical protein